MNPRRLYRSRDRQLAGVAGGMAEYLDIDPTVVRILWIIVGLASGGLALVAYFILALVMPQAPYPTGPGAWAPTPGGAGAAAGWGTPPVPAGASGWYVPPTPAGAAPWGPPAAAPGPGWDAASYAQPQVRQHAESRGIGATAIVGVVLIVIGGIALAGVALPGWIAGAIIGPAVIVTLGAALVVSSLRRRPDDAPSAPGATPASAPTPAAAPAPTATSPVPAPWDVTDTQAVGPAVFAPGSGTPSDETAADGARPA